MARGGPPRMREEAGDGNFILQIEKKWAIFKAGKTDWPSIPYLLIPKKYFFLKFKNHSGPQVPISTQVPQIGYFWVLGVLGVLPTDSEV